jgi:putative FmdB family regulatory protein
LRQRYITYINLVVKEVVVVPIYEYRCKKCGEVFEAFQKINDSPLTACKFCRGKVEQLISHSSFQLKGSGWYLTDYAKKSQPAGATTASDNSKGSEKTGAGTEAGTGVDKAGTTTPKTGKDAK